MNNLKHYIYKITDLTNSYIYIGVRTHPNPEIDTYMGSGNKIIKAIEEKGVDKFTKEILSIHTTRTDAWEEEKRVVDSKFVNRKDTYNLCIGGPDPISPKRFELWNISKIIIELYNLGYGSTSLSRIYQCDETTIRDILTTHRVIIRNTNKKGKGGKHWIWNCKELLIELYQINKLSATEIGKIIGCDNTTVLQALKFLNIPKNSRSHYSKRVNQIKQWSTI